VIEVVRGGQPDAATVAAITAALEHPSVGPQQEPAAEVATSGWLAAALAEGIGDPVRTTP